MPKCLRIRAKSQSASIQQLQEVMLDLDIVVRSRQAQPGRASSALRVVSFSLPIRDFQIDGHSSISPYLRRFARIV